MNTPPLAAKRILSQDKFPFTGSTDEGVPMDSTLQGLEEALLQDVPQEALEQTRLYLEEQGVYNKLASMVAERATDLISNEFMAHKKIEPLMEALTVATVAVQKSTFHPEHDFFSMHASVMDKIIAHAEVEPESLQKLDRSAEEAHIASVHFAMIQDRFGSRVPAATLSFMENFFDKKSNPEEHGVPDIGASLKAVEYALGEIACSRKETDGHCLGKDLLATSLYDLTFAEPTDDDLDGDDDTDDDDDDDDDDDIQAAVSSLVSKNPPGALEKAPVNKGERPTLAKELVRAKKHCIEMPNAADQAHELCEAHGGAHEKCHASNPN